MYMRKFKQMFWMKSIESPEVSPTGSSFDIEFETLEEEYVTSLHFPSLRKDSLNGEVVMRLLPS